MNKEKLRSLAWKLAQKLYVQEVRFSKYRKKIVEELDVEKWHGAMIPICQPRASGARNKHFWRELLFDGTPEEHAKYVSRHTKQILEGKNPKEKQPISEMTQLLRFIASDPSRKIREEVLITRAVENFALDFLSTVKARGQTIPKYAEKTFGILFAKLFEDLYSDTLTIRILIPIFRFYIAGPRVALKKDICIRRLEEYEIFDEKYLFPMKASIEGTLSHAIEITRNVPRDSFDANSVFSQADGEFVQELMDILTLFSENTICSVSAIVVNPFYEEEPVVAIPLKAYMKEANLPLIVDLKGRKTLMAFLGTVLEATKFFKTDPRLNICHDFYIKSLTPIRFEYQLLNILIGFEILFGSFGKDTARWVSLRVARLLGYLTSERSNMVLNDITRAFAVRNEFLHRGSIQKGSESSVKRSMQRLRRYLRKSILCVSLLMQKMTYENIMIGVDTAVQSPSVVLLGDEGEKLKKKLRSSER
jgi:hypothetical protein